MVRITAKDVKKRIKEIGGIIEAYKKEHPKKDRNYAEYEKEFKIRLKKAIRNLDKLIANSIRGIKVFYRNKDRHSLSLRKRIRLILVKELTEKGTEKLQIHLNYFLYLLGQISATKLLKDYTLIKFLNWLCLIC